MNDALHARAGDAFLALCDLAPAARAERLAALRRGDPELARAVEGLLAGDAAAGFLDGGAGGPGATTIAGLLGAIDDPPPAAPVPERVGEFRVVRVVGRGGMGVVLEAEQDYPRRRVALKLLAASFAHPERERRFRREIEVLAKLDHPGIARIHDAGVTDDGSPWFTMELVRGRPLLEHARDSGLSIAACVALLARVCDAVQHAHERGVVHRDLKPSNVLVDEGGAPRVLDFGIASAAADAGAEGTLRTATGVLMGTIGYMSPEQAAADGRPVDARSDVYSLGVIAYELFSGTPPLALSGRPLHDAARAVCEEDPPPLASHDRRLAGDLETIVHTALAKEPERRFASAAALAADLRRALAHEPIVARPATTFYKLAKFTRRNRGLVTGVALAFATLLAGTAAALWQAGRATRAGAAAVAAAERAELSSYLASIHGADAALALGDAETARLLLGGAPPELRGWEWRHLAARLDTSAALLDLGGRCVALRSESGPAGSVLQVLTQAGDLVRIASDLSTELSRTPVAGGPFEVARFAVDGSALVTATRDGELTIRDADGAPLGPPVRVARPLQVAVAPGGAWAVALVGSRGVFRAEPGAPEAVAVPGTEPGRPTNTHGVLVGADASVFLRGSSAGEVLACDPWTGAERALARGDRADVEWIAVAAGAPRIALGFSDRQVLVDDLASGERFGPFEGNVGSLYGVALSADGSRLATAGGDGLVRVWQLGRELPPERLSGHASPVLGLAFDADGETLAAHGQDGALRRWRLGEDPRSRVLRGHASWVYPVSFANDGLVLWSGAWDATLRAWDGRTGAAQGVVADLGEGGAVLSLACSPDGRLLAVGRRKARTWLLDAATGAVLAELDETKPFGAEALAFDASGETLATLSFDGYYSEQHAWVEVWDVASHARRHVWRVASNGFGGLAHDPRTGRWIVATQAHVTAFDPATGERSAQVTGGPRTFSLAVAPGGGEVATGHAGGQGSVIVLRDPATLAARRELAGHLGPIYALAYSPDGSRLASGARDGQIFLWDTRTGQRLARLSGHTNYVYSLAFSPDGTRLASGSGDGTVRLWDTLPRHAR